MSEKKENKYCYWSRADEDSDCWETSCDQAFCLDKEPQQKTSLNIVHIAESL